MTGRIFHLNDKGEATPMEEQPYDAEKTLQELLAKHPDLLVGDQIDSDEPRRWLLVSREMAVPGEEGGAGRWSLDPEDNLANLLGDEHDATEFWQQVKTNLQQRGWVR